MMTTIHLLEYRNENVKNQVFGFGYQHIENLDKGFSFQYCMKSLSCKLQYTNEKTLKLY